MFFIKMIDVVIKLVAIGRLRSSRDNSNNGGTSRHFSVANIGITTPAGAAVPGPEQG
jgi:hypothetical protein